MLDSETVDLDFIVHKETTLNFGRLVVYLIHESRLTDNASSPFDLGYWSVIRLNSIITLTRLALLYNNHNGLILGSPIIFIIVQMGMESA